MADDLGSRWDLPRVIASHTCPACKQELRTYWWKCKTHGDAPIDKPACPECVREGRTGDDLQKRPDQLGRFTCPKCLAKGGVRPFSVTGDTARFLRDGVNNHDYVKAETELGLCLNRGAFCPDCGSQLAPLCPYSDPHTDRPHYLYRHRSAAGSDRFRCYLHIDKDFYCCSSCEFPVEKTDQRCKRCGVELQDCFWCTPKHWVRVPKNGSDADAHRCPRCGLDPSPRLDGSRRVGPDDSKGSFCSNLYACSVGGHLDVATLPQGTSHCPICDSHELPPLLADTREHHIATCRYCTHLFNWKTDSGDRKGPKASELDRPPAPDGGWCPDAAPRKEQHCCLCGFRYNFTDFIYPEIPADAAPATSPSSPPDQPPPCPCEAKRTREAFLQIGTALRLHQDDTEAFRYLLRCLKDEVARLDEFLVCFLDRINRREVQKAATPRIGHIRELYGQQFGCQNDTDRATRCTCVG